MVCATLSDSQLVERAQAGDREARDTLVLRHRPFCLRYALTVWSNRRPFCGTLLDLDDLVQECLLALLRCVATVDVGKLNGRPLPWYAKLRVRNAVEDAVDRCPLVAVPSSTLWHYRHGNMSERGARDVAAVLARRTGHRVDLAVDRRLGPLDEAILNEMEG
jgi:DNA-directed RNA polymerase specialized sigma24 family protein